MTRPIFKREPRRDEPMPRLLGRAELIHGRWVFDPARRWRGGRRELTWRGTHAPEDGDYCIVELPDEGPARLVEVLGAEDQPQWDNAAVASQFRLPVHFSTAAESEAKSFAEPGAADRHGRSDLRELLVFTIDPEDARDHDDALSWRALAHGRHEVGIHIADVGHYVRPESALDREARLRGTSCYLPGGVVPMLPQRLSSDLCSLVPDRDRLAISVIATLRADGVPEATRFEETVIRSRHRLDYGRVQEALEGARPLDAKLQEAIEGLAGIARALRAGRRAAGALDLEVPEVKVWVDERGAPIRIERRRHLESHELIEEFMLLANRLVGSEGARRASGLIYRVHDPPSERRLGELDLILKLLGLPRPGDLRDPARALQVLLRAPLDAARRRLVHRLALRALARARYFERDTGHFGLAAREYCHFTSPIRRYPDLHNHRRVREWIRRGRSTSWDPVELGALAERCSGTEQNAAEAEREAVKVKGLRHLEGRLGEHASGIITGLIPRGFFVELDDVPVEGFVRPAQDLDDHFVLDASGARLVGRRSRRRFSLGDAVRVIVARVDVPARECDMALEAPRNRRRHRWRS